MEKKQLLVTFLLNKGEALPCYSKMKQHVENVFQIQHFTESAEVKIFEGESENGKYDRFLGEVVVGPFDLPHGLIPFEVDIHVDTNHSVNIDVVFTDSKYTEYNTGCKFELRKSRSTTINSKEQEELDFLNASQQLNIMEQKSLKILSEHEMNENVQQLDT